MRPMTPEFRRRLESSRTGRWCGTITLAMVAFLYHNASGWRLWVCAAGAVVALAIQLFWWFRLRQYPPDVTATQG